MCNCVCCRYNIENVSEYYLIKAKRSYWKDKNGIKHMALKLNLNKKRINWQDETIHKL